MQNNSTTEPRYCSLLWKHMSNEPGGTVRTCCIARERVTREDGTEFTMGEDSVRDIFHSEYYKNIRQEIREGKLPKNCETCWIDEANGKQSKRQIYNEYAAGRYEPIKWVEEPDMPEDLQIVFSNTCNLKCRSCNANYSSKWVKESKARNIPVWESPAVIDMNDMANSKFWTEMDDWIQHVRYLEVPGGEPFYMKEFKIFIDRLIDTGNAPEISINLSTNGTLADKDFLEKMYSNFKGLAFSISIDGVGDRFNYIRHPGKWSEVQDNLDHFYELHQDPDVPVFIQITHTVTALNVMYLPEFHTFFEERWPRWRIWNNLALFPTWIGPDVFPDEHKEEIISHIMSKEWKRRKIGEIEGIVNFMRDPQRNVQDPAYAPYFKNNYLDLLNDRELQWQAFKYQIAAGDLYRKESFMETFPELYKIIRPSYNWEAEFGRVQNEGYTLDLAGEMYENEFKDFIRDIRNTFEPQAGPSFDVGRTLFRLWRMNKYGKPPRLYRD